MAETVKIMSPVDGSVYAERPVARRCRDRERRSARPRRAQQAWGEITVARAREVPQPFRRRAARQERRDRARTRLADGPADPLRRREARRRGAVAAHDRHRRGQRWRPSETTDKPGFRRMITHEPLGMVMVIAPWNYPFLTAVNSIVPGADGRQRGDPQACQPDAAGRRALRRGDARPPACRTGCSRTSC